MRAAALVLGLALAAAGCGRQGALEAPPGADPDAYPRTYPPATDAAR